MAVKSWSLSTPADDALKNTVPGLIRDVKEHAFTASGFYAEQQSTPDDTIAIYAGVVYFGITKVEYAGLDIVDLGTGGGFETTALTASYYNKVLFTINSSGTLEATEGTEHAVLASVVEPAIPAGKFPICMVSVQDDGTATAGTILTIEQSEIKQLQGVNAIAKTIATDTIWAAAGDLVQGTGNDTAAVLTKGGALALLRMNSGATAVEWGTGGQIAFPATAVPSADPNTLDDYEEGTWTAGISFGGAAVGVTYAGQAGTYIKIGRKITCVVHLVLTSKGSSNGNAAVTGLPFSVTGNVAAFVAHQLNIAFVDTLYGFANSTVITLEETTNAGARSSITDADMTNTAEAMFNVTYFEA
jgi:hypothetical protein